MFKIGNFAPSTGLLSSRALEGPKKKVQIANGKGDTSVFGQLTGACGRGAFSRLITHLDQHGFPCRVASIFGVIQRLAAAGGGVLTRELAFFEGCM